MKSVFVAFAATLLIAGSPQAAVFTWIGGGGNTRMNNGGNWSPGAPANANDTDWILTDVGADPGSTYANFTARSISFADDIDTTFNFGINRSTSFTRNVTLESNNGTATIAVDTGAAGNIAITGTTPNTGIQNALRLNSALNVNHNGTGNLTLAARIGNGTSVNGITKTGSGTLVLSSANNDYTGDTVVNDGRLTVHGNGRLLFDIDASGVNNSLYGDVISVGDVVFNGDAVFDLTGASTTIGDMWQIVDETNLSVSFTDGQFGARSTVGSFTESSDIWSINENGVGYEFSESTGVLTVVAVPEPSSTALLCLGVLALRFRRRK